MRSFLLPAATVLVFSSLVACSASDEPENDFFNSTEGQEVDETGDEEKTAFFPATADTAGCATGAFDDQSGFCVANGKAIGPFTSKMNADCKAAGESFCNDASWPLEAAKGLRGAEPCPAGASIDDKLGVCVEGNFAFGPFDDVMVEECRAAGGTSCDSMKWDLSWVSPLVDLAETSGGGVGTQNTPGECNGVNARMMASYATRAGYNQVSRLGMRTLGTRRNGCAAWLSHAIRSAGGSMPVETNTENFRDALLARGWTRVSRSNLRPGDVVITADRRGWRGHPDHVYMFAGWQDRAQTVPLAVDNQGFTHPRYRGKSPIAFGLRAPDASSSACNGNPPPPAEDAGRGISDCAGREDGWYCSASQEWAAHKCLNGQISSGWQCAGGTVIRCDGEGRASMYGDIPGCYGSR